MRLQFPFIQLPLRFDAAALAAELATVSESEWIPHPQGFAGNSALPLISVDGDPGNDGVAGLMRPTVFLERLPHLRQVLASFGTVLGRTRLMRLSGQAEVTPHVDEAYYWTERMRVHVPIVTQPGVRFYCGDAEIHMAAGECWIFDTWRTHRVLNNGEATRIHLVADTVGGDGFWELMTRARPHHVSVQGWPVREVSLDAQTAPLRYESANAPRVMTPWELQSHSTFLLGELVPNPLAAEAQQTVMRFKRRWHALWACHGDGVQGFTEYRNLRDEFVQGMVRFKGQLKLRNQMDFHRALTNMVIGSLLANETAPSPSGEARDAVPVFRAIDVRDAEFDRPVFIVCPPRSGSTLLFETLAQAKNIYTVGGEAHGLIEGLPPLRPLTNGYDSNRLDASVAGSRVAAALRMRFRAALIDRDGGQPYGNPLRMLEKTPKNSLRIPFLTQVFPEARFVYLHRDVREVLASMLEGWHSGRFVTYAKLPGWSGLPWSFVLTPGWRELVGKPLHEIVAAQWQATTRILLDDLAALPAGRVHVARYDALIADPAAQIAPLCAALDFAWDRPLDRNLPLSRYTLSKPEHDKWRRHQAEIDAVLPSLHDTIARSETFTAR